MTYRLYGWQSSPYTAKVRSYLAYKRVPHRDIVPHAWQLKRVIEKRVGRIVMPVVLTPDDETLQDSTLIIDAIETAHDAPSVYPREPSLALAALLIELFADEWVPILAMHTRWSNPANHGFILGEFGRDALPRFPRFIQRRAGAAIGGKMQRYLPILGITPETAPAIDEWCAELLAAIDAHLDTHAFILGGRPSLADFALYGPIYAHFWHDPISRPRVEPHRNLKRWLDGLTAGATAEDEFGVSAGRR